MSITKNVFRLNDVYDLVASNQIVYDANADPGARSLWYWGSSCNGALGNNNASIHISSPVQLPGTAWCCVAAAGHTLALKTDNTLWAWGFNTNRGQLGDNTMINKSSPVQIPGTAWSDVDVGGSGTSIALKTDGTLWTWGDDDEGRLGNNTAGVHKSSPIQIPGTSWCGIVGGQYGNAGLKTDGTLWAWGRDGGTGLRGVNTSNISVSSPVQIPGTQWNDIEYSSFSAAARKTDGTLWTWGRASYGVLGNDSLIYRSSPIQVPGTQWNDISLSNNFVLARKSDGTLWAWGRNNTGPGQLGDNTTANKSSPIQIPGTQWNDISAGSNSSFARKTDGTLWAWGDNTYGNLGDNTTICRSSPIQIPGTAWNDISGSSRGFAIKVTP
jgi:alpha-tubulin suppressor-like RCC1 family protein